MISYEFLTTQTIGEALNYLDKFSKVHILAGGQICWLTFIKRALVCQILIIS